MGVGIECGGRPLVMQNLHFIDCRFVAGGRLNSERLMMAVIEAEKATNFTTYEIRRASTWSVMPASNAGVPRIGR
jgi:hypothetical protein